MMTFHEIKKILTEGYLKYLPANHICFDRYYTPGKNVRESYDLLIPRKAKGDMGLVLCVHGGGWVEGKKDEYTKSLPKVSTEHGLACACMNYRYASNEVDFEAILDDISLALSEIKRQAAKHGVNINKVLLTGISAGAHLSLLYAYTRRRTAPVAPVCVVELCGPTDLTDPFYFAPDNSVNRAVGVGYFRDILSKGSGFNIDLNDIVSAQPALAKGSPINYIDNHTVPTIFGHGEQDEIVPYQNALDLDRKLTEYGIEHTFVSFPNSGHGCEDKTSLSKIMKLFFEYADKYLK